MNTHHYLKSLFVILAIISLVICTGLVNADKVSYSRGQVNRFDTTISSKTPYNYLSNVMDQFHSSYDVYSDADAAGNHFAHRGWIGEPAKDAIYIIPMDETNVDNPHSGITAIKCQFLSEGKNWEGWYFMNGVLQDEETMPKENWGTYKDAGVDLRGATKLTFWARGDKGGEKVEFFAFGVGRDADTGDPESPYPDSSPKKSTGFITLSKGWKQYTIDLSGADLSYVLGGFGWVTNASENQNNNIIFYLDDIKYNKARLTEPRFLVSYTTEKSSDDFDEVLRNVAFVYDNDIALIAFIAENDMERAKIIADALVYAVNNDRSYSNSQMRNAYQGGDIALSPGWTPNGQENSVRMPGWYDPTDKQWYEDEFQVSTHTGNVAWTMLALLAYYEKAGGDEYLNTAMYLGDWVETNTRDPAGYGGYFGGFEGWEPNEEQKKLTYKSTEHNIDLYVAFMRLYNITGDERYLNRAEYAKQFIIHMWDENDGKFWTGTVEKIEGEPDQINTEVIPLDIQAWAILALRDQGESYRRALTYVETHHKIGNGFAFKEVNQKQDGVWYEGTAQMAVAYHETGQLTKWKTTVKNIKSAQDKTSGGIYATDRDQIWTGFFLPDNNKWLYYHRVHVGATAWYILAEKGVNPYWPNYGGTITPTTTTKVPTTTRTQTPTGIGGTLKVICTPSGASVFLDGENKGETPLTLAQLQPGMYHLKVTKSGYEDYSVLVNIRIGRTVTASDPLTLLLTPTSTTTVPTTIPTQTVSSVSLLSPKSNENVKLTPDSNGLYTFSISGSTSHIAFSNSQILLWIRPISPSSERPGWYLQRDPNGIRTIENDGSWTGVAQLGNARWPPHNGDTFDLAVTILDTVTSNHLMAESGDVVKSSPIGTPSDFATTLVVTL